MICLLYEEDVKYEKKNNRFIVNNHIFLMYLSVISFIVNRTQLLNSSISIAVATIIVIVISYILSKITVNRIVNYN